MKGRTSVHIRMADDTLSNANIDGRDIGVDTSP